jgi:hypothetical protein
MTSRLLKIVAAAVLMLGLSAEGALACSCAGSGPPCQAAYAAHVVFAGTVRAIDRRDPGPGELSFDRVRVSFEVTQGFLNMVAREVVVATGSGGGDCGYGFRVGQQYLVYAWKAEAGLLSTGICSRTRLLAEAAEDLAYLKALPPASAGARVYGRISEWQRHPAEERAVDYGPMEGVRVTIEGLAFQRDAVTDANGRFEVTSVPLGNATVTVLPPPGFDVRYLSRPIELRDSRACHVVDFQLSQRATASGTVVDASGSPIVGVFVDAVAAELAGYDPPPYQYPVKTDERGRFTFEGLPPGIYVFGINLTKPVFGPRTGTPVFLPGVGKASDARVIDLKPNDDRDVGVLTLPSR